MLNGCKMNSGRPTAREGLRRALYYASRTVFLAGRQRFLTIPAIHATESREHALCEYAHCALCERRYTSEVATPHAHSHLQTWNQHLHSALTQHLQPHATTHAEHESGSSAAWKGENDPAVSTRTQHRYRSSTTTPCCLLTGYLRARRCTQNNRSPNTADSKSEALVCGIQDPATHM